MLVRPALVSCRVAGVPDRIDILGSRPERAAAFRGRVLDSPDDPVLDGIAAEAASELKAPTCLVSLVLDRLQIFRASSGLAGLLALDRATDRDLSICQYVVRDRAMVAVADTHTDPRVPGLTARNPDLGAYLGAPVQIGGEVVGSLCIIDRAPRQFDAGERATLTRHAERVSARLEELAATRRGSDGAAALLRAATRPTFQDLRNALWQLSLSLDQIRIAAAEAQRLSALLGAKVILPDGAAADLSSLSGAGQAVRELQSLADGAQEALQRTQEGVLALEAASQREGSSADLAVAAEAAARLAGHYTRLVHGVGGLPLPSTLVQAPPGTAILSIAMALSTVSQALLDAGRAGPLQLSCAARGDRMVLRIAGAEPVAERVAPELRRLAGAGVVAVEIEGGALCLFYRAAS